MHDVVIIGGGLYGSSTAYHLLRRDPGLVRLELPAAVGAEDALDMRNG